MIGKDLEMFCDEQVLKGKSLEEKKHYSQTLLDFAVEKKRNFHVMMQFGENGTGKRIEHILHVKKPKFVISMLLLVLVAGCGIFFLTSGSTNKTEYGSKEADLSDNEYVQAVKKTKESGYDGETVSYTWELDFDGNGKNEAFVAVGNETEGKLEGDIWFVNERKEAVLWKEAICAESGQEYFAADGKAYLFLTCVDGNAVQTDVYGITENSSDDAAEGRDKMPENVISFAGTKYLNENGTVTCNVTDMDGCYMPEDDCFVERTIKPYTFLYKNGVFVDMPGREVTEEEVKKMGNLGAVTVTLEMDGHDKDERQYILREDGTLQINLAHLYEDDISFTYVTCSLGEDKVWEHIKRGAGFYRLSLGTEKETKEESWLSRLKAEMEIPRFN